MYKVLLLEDDLTLQDMLVEYFIDNSYYIRYCSYADEVLDLVTKEKFDIWIFDVKIPKGNGFELLKELRTLNFNTPTIFTTSLNDISDLEKGFNAGCNDYLKKPYNLKELLIRVNSLLKDNIKEEILNDGFKYDFSSNLLYKNNSLYPLSKKELKLLHLFITNKNKLITIEKIFEELWEYEEPSFLSLRAYIKNIRKILGKENILNKRSEGYIFVK